MTIEAQNTGLAVETPLMETETLGVVCEQTLVITGGLDCVHCVSAVRDELAEFAPQVSMEVVKMLPQASPRISPWGVVRLQSTSATRPFAGVATAIDEADYRLFNKQALRVVHGQ